MFCAKIQAAYETLSEDDKRAKYDTTAGFKSSSRSTRVWREPSYGPCHAYTQDPAFWSVELRAMTVQKCARITKIQHLEREIRELVINLDNLVTAEDRAVSKEKKAHARFAFRKSRSSKLNAQRHHDFLTKFACINAHLNNIKTELRTAHEDHRKLLERDNERKAWWARERIKRVEEENRRAATTAAEAARRRAERAREHRRNRETEAAGVAEERRQGENNEEAARAARAAKARAERAREDPKVVRTKQREAQEWLARQREILLEHEKGAGD